MNTQIYFSKYVSLTHTLYLTCCKNITNNIWHYFDAKCQEQVMHERESPLLAQNWMCALQYTTVLSHKLPLLPLRYCCCRSNRVLCTRESLRVLALEINSLRFWIKRCQKLSTNQNTLPTDQYKC